MATVESVTAEMIAMKLEITKLLQNHVATEKALTEKTEEVELLRIKLDFVNVAIGKVQDDLTEERKKSEGGERRSSVSGGWLRIRGCLTYQSIMVK